MTDTKALAIDLIRISPDNSTGFINAPDIDENSVLLELLHSATTAEYDWQVNLTAGNKARLTDIIANEESEGLFHRMDIKNANEVLFIAYDGFCSVEVIDKAIVPHWFVEKYAESLIL